jgi:AbrB family looped-hinge helix DNA binding protein
MATVTVSPKFQVVIPKEVRESMHLVPGEHLQVIQLGHRIELIRVQALESMKGFLKGMDTNFDREED